MTSGSHGDTRELEVTEFVIILGELTLTLEDSDTNLGLIISSSREDLTLLGRDGSVSVNKSSENTTHGLDTQRKRSNIEQENILDITSEYGTLNGSTNGNSLIGINTSVRLLAEEALNNFTNLRDSSGTTNEKNLIDLILGQTGILQAVLKGLNSALDKSVNETLEFCSGELHIKMLGARVIESKIWDRDSGLGSRRKLDLGLLGSLSNSLDGTLIGADVHTTGLNLEFSSKELLEFHIEIFTTESSITVSGLNLKDTTADFEDRDIEGTTTEIVNGNDLTVSLIKTESEGSGSRLVDDSLNIKVGNLTSILGSLSLGIVEISRDGNNGFLNSFTHVSFSGLLHLNESESTNLLGRVLLSTSFNPSVTVGGSDNLVWQMLHILLGLIIVERTTNESLGSVESVLRVLDGLSLSDITNVSSAIIREGNNRWGSSLTFSVLDNLGGSGFHNSNARVGGTKINTDNAAERSLGLVKHSFVSGGGSLASEHKFLHVYRGFC
mmetsp:Transcript_113992/g.157989  ORF Transcript_113992/g.157989 Transcript_113992/m.157989 type:complete len:497 (+) Transcript_113992:667-2157(+)